MTNLCLTYKTNLSFFNLPGHSKFFHKLYLKRKTYWQLAKIKVYKVPNLLYNKLSILTREVRGVTSFLFLYFFPNPDSNNLTVKLFKNIQIYSGTMFSLTSFKLIKAAYPEYSVQICIAVYCRIQRFDNFFFSLYLIELIQSKATNNARNSTKNMYSNSKIIVVNDMQFIPSYYLSTDWLL